MAIVDTAKQYFCSLVEFISMIFFWTSNKGRFSMYMNYKLHFANLCRWHQDTLIVLFSGKIDLDAILGYINIHRLCYHNWLRLYFDWGRTLNTKMKFWLSLSRIWTNGKCKFTSRRSRRSQKNGLLITFWLLPSLQS